MVTCLFSESKLLISVGQRGMNIRPISETIQSENQIINRVLRLAETQSDLPTCLAKGRFHGTLGNRPIDQIQSARMVFGSMVFGSMVFGIEL